MKRNEIKKEKRPKATSNSNIKKLLTLLIIIALIIILIIKNHELINKSKSNNLGNNISADVNASKNIINTSDSLNTSVEFRNTNSASELKNSNDITTANNTIIFEINNNNGDNISNQNSNIAETNNNGMNNNSGSNNLKQQGIKEYKDNDTNTNNNNNDSNDEKVQFEEVLKSNTLYYIRVNNEQNVVNIFKKGEDGKHNIPYKVMLCSTGTFTPTCNKYPKKAYKITGTKYRWATLQQSVYGQYATQITGNILFHSVPYSKYGNAGSLEYWEYDKLGTKASLGCIRLRVEDAKWIYDNIVAGTVVEFYRDDNPGPMGKPSLETISDNEECRKWDPTDTSANSPWNQD